MSDTSQFRTVDAWKRRFGLLPVRLRYDEENIDRYVLLNGSRGNFCLDFVGDVEPRSQRAVAWSCDVGHYITCAGDSISVNRWTGIHRKKRFFPARVYLLRFTSSTGISKRVRRINRRVCGSWCWVSLDGLELRPKTNVNGLQSIIHFAPICLLPAASGGDRLSDAGDLAVWGLSPEVVERSRTINATSWDTLCNDLSGPGRYDVLRPEFTLVLRHASGALVSGCTP